MRILCTHWSTLIGILLLTVDVVSLPVQTPPPAVNVIAGPKLVSDNLVGSTAPMASFPVVTTNPDHNMTPDPGLCLVCIEKTVDGFTTYENAEGETLSSCAYKHCSNPDYEVCLQITRVDQMEHRCGSQEEICGIVGEKSCTHGGSIQIYVPPENVPTLSQEAVTVSDSVIDALKEGPTSMIDVGIGGAQTIQLDTDGAQTTAAQTTAAQTTTSTAVTNYCYVCRPIIDPSTIGIGKSWTYVDLDTDLCPNGSDDKVAVCQSDYNCFQESYNGGRPTGYYCGPTNIILCPDTEHCQEKSVMLDEGGRFGGMTDPGTTVPITTKPKQNITEKKVVTLIDCKNEVDGCKGNKTDGGNTIVDPIEEKAISNGSVLSCNILAILAIVMCSVLLGEGSRETH